MSGLTVLVTGGAGRLGRSVVAGLAAAGHQPVSVDVAPSRGVESFPADLTDAGEAYAAMARYRPDAVVHLAALAVPFSRPEAVIHRTNTSMAFNVVQAAVDGGARSVVVASSPTVVGYGNPAGWRPRRLPIDEDHPVRPWHAYALSKLHAEATMSAFAARCCGDVHLSAFRPCYVVAPEEWEGAPTQSGHTVRERLDDPALGAVALFNYVDARDAADMVVTLVDPPDGVPSGEVFFASASDALAREPLAELVPRFHPGTHDAAAPLTGTRPAFSSEKAHALLGWRPRRSWRTELST